VGELQIAHPGAVLVEPGNLAHVHAYKMAYMPRMRKPCVPGIF
jgi:hypothetical protein